MGRPASTRPTRASSAASRPAAAPGAVDGPASAPPDLGASCASRALSASSPAIARARGHAKRAGSRQAVSIEPGGRRRRRWRARGARERRSCRRTGRRRRTGGRGPRLHWSPSVLGATGERAPVRGARSQADARRVRGVPATVGPGGLGVRRGRTARPWRTRFGRRARGARVELGRDRVADRGARVPRAARRRRRRSSCPIPPAAPSTAVEVLEPDFRAVRRPACARRPKERRKWARREGVSCYRVYDADLPDYAVAIDVYRGRGRGRGQHCTCTSPSTRRPRSVDPGTRAAGASTTCWRSRPWCWACAPTTCSRRCAAATRAAAQYRDAEPALAT